MDVALGYPALVALIAIALVFDMLNGLHDAANSIATVVSTRVLAPQYAVAWAAFFNFIAFLFFGLNVAHTVGTGIISAEVVDVAVIFGALLGAICWNLITWWLGIPSSSSHALTGGLAGAGFMKAGFGAIVWTGLGITGAAIFLSPLLGFFLALLLVLIVSWIFVRATPVAVDNFFRILQFLSAALYSLGHGGNDAQKTMGIIAVLLFSQGKLGDTFYVPFWVISKLQWGWEPCSGDGGSFAPWGRGSPGCIRFRASAQRRAARRRCFWPPPWASRFPPPTPSRGPLSGWAQPAKSRPSDGMWRALSWSPGSSRCLPRR